VLGGALYAVGGHDGWSYLSSVERYDPDTDVWTHVASTSAPRSTLGVAVVGDRSVILPLSLYLWPFRCIGTYQVSVGGYHFLLVYNDFVLHRFRYSTFTEYVTA